jgi:spore coat polysaccharide biosynthesis protein SpsF
MSYRDKKIVACIIVRMKSTRLPKKALADICGKPLTLHLIERLRKTKTIDEIVLCTSTHPDDAILLDFAIEWGIKSFAGSEDDVLSRLMAAAELHHADIVLRVTGDNILTDPEIIDQMVERHVDFQAEYTRTNNLPLGVTAEVMSASMLRKLHKLMPDPNQSEYMMLYAFDPDNFSCEVLNAPQNLRRPNYSLTVDTPSDLKLIQQIYTELDYSDGGPKLKDIIPFLDANPEKLTVSDDTPIRLPEGETKSFREMLELLDKRASIAKRKRGIAE